MSIPVTVTVASYNILADAYINPAYYPHTPAAVLEPAARRAALLDHIAQIARRGAEVLCLQEVQEDAFSALCARLAPMHGVFRQKSQRRPDGCATFLAPRLVPQHTQALYYPDDTGHLALIVVADFLGQRLGIANTHLRWDPPQTPVAAQVGRAQLIALLDAVERITPRCHGFILCGDFNAGPDSALVQAACERGFRDPYAGERAETCNSNRSAKRIDYLLHSPTLRCQPHPLRSIHGDTPLPSSEEPSDHLAVMGSFGWETL